MLLAALLAIAPVVSAGASPPDLRDLQRAKTKVPRAGWKGRTYDSMSAVLNGHLRKMFPRTRPCHEWTAEQLQAYQAQLYSHRQGDLDGIYNSSSDSRRMRRGSLGQHRSAWERANGLARRFRHRASMHRDGHCHEAVMWLVHHVPAAEQHSVFAKQPVPLLSEQRHSCEAAVGEEAELCQAYEAQMSCADCHSGSGIEMQDYSDPYGYLSEDPEHPGWARQRRCDQNYRPTCGPCEGIGGPYWGDKVSDFQPTNCEVVSESVPESDRPAPQFPEQFIVHQLGSDRLARTQNQARFALYSQIRSTLWYDFPVSKSQSSMAKLRHDTYYDDRPYTWVDSGLVSELHFQSQDQREANVTGPMVSLIHGLLGFGKYLGGCTCLADPVGVPVLSGTVDVRQVPHGSFMLGADYKGRIKIGVEYDGFKLGDKGHGDMKRKRNMTVDHYVKWFLHLFVDADRTSPTYGQPVRFYGPYSGFAVYVSVNKTVPPAEVWDTACVDNGWGEPLESCAGKKLSELQCMNVEKHHPEVCKPYEAAEEREVLI